jgi:hypothetical protein
MGMVALQLLPVGLSLLVLGAHFLRAGRPLLALVVLLTLALLFVRRRWAARVVQGVLGLGGLVWIRTLVVLASLRIHTGEPVRRMVIILGSVAAVSLLSALLIQVGALRRFYRLDDGNAPPAA